MISPQGEELPSLSPTLPARAQLWTSSGSLFGGASRTPVAEGGGALCKARRSISPREKSGEFGSVGSAPSSGRALHWSLQVAIVVVRERSHLERVGDRCRSTGIRLSQRNSTHMLGTSPLTHEAQHSAACEQEVHHAAPNRRFSRMCRVSAEDFVLGRGAQR